MGLNTVDYLSGLNTAAPSGKLWKDWDPIEAARQPSYGYQFGSDFADGVAPFGVSVGDTSAAGLAGYTGGAVRLPVGSTDNNQVLVGTGAEAFEISDTAGEQFELWFEARIRTSSIADNAAALFCGLSSLHAVDLLADNSGAFIATAATIGFQILQADGDNISFTYQAASQTPVVPIATLQVPVASTWYKLGFHYKPSAPDAKKISVWLDGAEQSTYVTATNIAAATFPDAEQMGPVLTAKTGGAVAFNVDCDWMYCAQRRDAGTGTLGGN